MRCNRFCLFLGEALNCNFCYSNKSWYECDSTSEQRPCPEHKVCIKIHRLVKQGENEIHHYNKGCLPSSNCNGEECKDYGQSCRVDCCNTDGCNGSMFLNANYMTLLTLALLIIVHFLWIFVILSKKTLQTLYTSSFVFKHRQKLYPFVYFLQLVSPGLTLSLVNRR